MKENWRCFGHWWRRRRIVQDQGTSRKIQCPWYHQINSTMALKACSHQLQIIIVCDKSGNGFTIFEDWSWRYLQRMCKRKKIKNPFLKSETNTKGTLEFIHCNVCGPVPSTYLSGYEYYVTFIDEYSRKTWIYLLKTKSEVFEKFKEFKSLKRNIQKEESRH